MTTTAEVNRFSQLYEQRHDSYLWRQGAHIRYWGASVQPSAEPLYKGESAELVAPSARRELARIRPWLLKDGVIDLGCGIYPEESFRIISGGNKSMRYVGVDTFEAMTEPLALDPIPDSAPHQFTWPRSRYPRPTNAAVVKADMEQFLKEFLSKSSERIHFFVNGHDDALHYGDKGKAKAAKIVTRLENAQEGSMVFGFSVGGGILHLMRSNPAFELTAHFPAGKSDDGFLFFQKR